MDDSDETTVFGGCQMHKGFAEQAQYLIDQDAFESLVSAEMSNCEAKYGSECELVITGHSAGAPLALYAAAYYNSNGTPSRVITFGAMPSMIIDTCSDVVNTERVYNFFISDGDMNDPVPFYDFSEGYSHIGRMIELEDGDDSSVKFFESADDLGTGWEDMDDIGDFLLEAVSCAYRKSVAGWLVTISCDEDEIAELHTAETYDGWFGSGSASADFVVTDRS